MLEKEGEKQTSRAALASCVRMVQTRKEGGKERKEKGHNAILAWTSMLFNHRVVWNLK